MTTKKTIELVKEGFANGVAKGGPLDDYQKNEMIQKAAVQSADPVGVLV